MPSPGHCRSCSGSSDCRRPTPAACVPTRRRCSGNCYLHQPDLRQPACRPPRSARQQPAPHLSPHARPAAQPWQLRPTPMGRCHRRRSLPRLSRRSLDRMPAGAPTGGPLGAERQRPHPQRRAPTSHQLARRHSAHARLRLHAPRACPVSWPAPRRQRPLARELRERSAVPQRSLTSDAPSRSDASGAGSPPWSQLGMPTARPPDAPLRHLSYLKLIVSCQA
jgi:hypothetical protein